jgi:FlaA1/EpsC-like NDP-sugar epimerase
MDARKYFCVSTDKASNPVNMMGASKRIMEMFLLRRSENVAVSTARFANVAFSDGSLPFSWRRRLERRQPLVAPDDVRRYFVTDIEGGQLCLMSTFLGENRDIFFPKLSEKLHLEKFSVLARRFLESRGLEPVECASEDEARGRVDELAGQKRWPCYFFESDTTGEKDFEEFYTDAESVDWDRFAEIGVVKVDIDFDDRILDHFTRSIEQFREQGSWSRRDLVGLFGEVLPHFAHKETGKFLDEKM